MAVGKTKLHDHRIIDQVKQNLIGLQRDIVNNAKSHKAMAQAKSPDLTTLQSFVADSANAYTIRLDWQADYKALAPVLKDQGLTESDFTTIANGLRQAVTALSDHPKGSYEDIIAACDRVLALVEPPVSLWPE